MTPAPLTLRVPTIEIRNTANNTLVTSIEILSPVNKREPGLTQYRQKRQRLYNANVDLIEIDLLRRATRPFQHPHIPDVSYLISLIRAYSGVVNIWTIKLQDRLPIIPIPLHTPDTDIALDLQDALHTIFDEAAYDLSIDYNQLPPPPSINMVDAEWIQTLLKT